ncbi:adenosylcobinamide-GDP ribazoletransferase [Natranaerofaba carboxydovora]|uniref:adenosylcobinamide-GDP ribazoletransferase n=1 Tax=Natranaerofaba carboxydovora TaxID=2742683 RepID=UPI001F13BEB7|nr:adenosylcobinamide-GDP ribazoletransferase [Natranaerofaba carboxydovora]UMZ73145.1 Adenosylcobinamide-GDP ribazoletransferase [Natranaerofaba carboxydovora]
MNLFKQIKTFYKRLYSAITLLTVVPMPGWQLDFTRTTHYFPWVGVILSFIYLFLFLVLDGLVSPFMLAFLLVLLDGFLTGGLHLDGFSDWIDGIYSRKEGDDLRAVLKDSNIGAIGAAGLVFLILGKVIFLREVLISEFSLVWILFFPWFARILMYLVIVSFPYPSGKKGLGQICQEDYSILGHLWAVLSGGVLLLALYFFFPENLTGTILTELIIAAVISGSLTYLFIKRLSIKLGGVNGDGYGACCEFSQVMVLLMGSFLI